MSVMKLYRKRADATVCAVRIDLDIDTFRYRKWGGIQSAKSGDWLVNSQGDTYTVDHDSFSKTYQLVKPGIYRKVSPVWAKRADRAGVVDTREGSTRYEVGEYLVFNDAQAKDGYAISADKFCKIYEEIEQTCST